MATLTYHKSVTVAYAEELENEHIENLRKNNCITKQTKTYYNVTVDGVGWEVVLGSYIDILTDENNNDVEDPEGPKTVNSLDTTTQTIEYCIKDNCAQYEYTDSYIETNQFKLEEYNERCNMCTPLPYKGDTAPIALEWYSPLRWWDIFMLTVAGVIQFRLKSIEDGDGYGSYGPLVVDEKDIAMTSIQLLTIIMTISFYSIELTMSSLWLTLHNNADLDVEHTSYYTVLERNLLLVKTNSIWIVLMMPLFVIAYKIKLQIQKYEQNQFLTEL